MQMPDGRLIPLPHDFKLKHALEESTEKERTTGKPHPVFVVGEELEIKGARWRVRDIKKNRMTLKPVRY